jgi:phospholipid-binding lipoprotein MlaA
MKRSVFFYNISLLLKSLVLASVLGGCATTTDPRDPWEGMNRGIYAFNDGLDKYVLKPTAKGYRWITPDIVDQGISNFFSNIRDIRVTINDILQIKFKQGGMDFSRFVINTTAGIAGFIDVATMLDLPKHNEDFDQTLGFWGVPPGPYVVLPLYGASSVRGVVGFGGDLAMNPLTYTFLFGDSVFSAASLGLGILDVVDIRADALEVVEIADEAALDPYAFYRDAYMQRRIYLINDGVMNYDDEDYDLDDDFDEGLDEPELEPDSESEQTGP